MDEETDKKTSDQVERKVPNPTGKGGFKDNPENINAGGRPKNQERYGYWLDYFKNLPKEVFKSYLIDNPDLSMAARAAWERIMRSIDQLDEFKEVANRTEGMPKSETNLNVRGQINSTKLMELLSADEDTVDTQTNTEG